MDIEQTMDEIEVAIGEVAAAEAAADERRQRLQRQAIRALATVETDEQQRRLVAQLYWRVPVLTVRSIAEVVGKDRDVRTLAGPGPSIAPCSDCGEERSATTRTQLRSPPTLCPSCEQRERRRQAERRQREQQAMVQREIERDRQAWLAHLRQDHPAAQAHRDIGATPTPWTCDCASPSTHDWW